MKKELFVRDISDNTPVDAPFLLLRPEIREGKQKRYISCILSDKTGEISCTIWGTGDAGHGADSVYPLLVEGEVYRICGNAKVWQGNCILNINEGVEHLASPLGEDTYEAGDYVATPAGLAENAHTINSLISEIEEPGLRKLVYSAVMDAPGFFEKPAASFYHHDYEGGLAEHSAEVAEIALFIGDTVKRTGIDRDVLLAGAILHDIGKTADFERRGPGYVPVPEKDMVGHIARGIAMVISMDHSADERQFSHLLHIIASHHGEHGDTLPRTPEAWAVHCADMASSRIRAVADDCAGFPEGRGGAGKRSRGRVFRF